MRRVHREEMAQLIAGLERWRSQYSGPTPIPDEIWLRAARLASKIGVPAVAQELKLGYSKLKKLADRTGKLELKATATFVEFQPQVNPQPQLSQGVDDMSSPLPIISCAIEVKSSSGSFLRAKLEGLSATDLGLVFREFGR